MRFILRAMSCVVVGCTMLACATSAQAQCYVLRQAVPDSPYEYLLAFAEALSDANDANKGVDEKSPPIDLLIGMRRNRATYKCAESRVAPYQSSSDDAIATSAKGSTAAFAALASNQENLSKHLTQMMDQLAEGTFKPGTAAETTARLTTAGEDAGSLLITAAVAATFAAIAPDPKTGLMSRLSVTAVERDEILGKLRATFGVSVTKGVQSGQGRLVGAAAAVYKVLSDPQRQPKP